MNITPPKLFLDVDFWKSKYVTGRLPKVKIYYQKSTFESQNILPEVDFRKSKN